MNLLADHPALNIYVMVSCLVAVHLVLLGFFTGAARVRRKVYVNPEDAAAFKGSAADVEHPTVMRTKRAHMNALENAVAFFAIGLCYALTQPNIGAVKAYFFTFLGARVLHSIAYLAGRQPFRTFGYSIGSLALVGMAVHVIRVTL